MAEEKYNYMTARELAEKILALPEEQQNVPAMISYYDDPEYSVPVTAVIDDLVFYESGFPFNGPHLHLIHIEHFG